MHTYAHTHYIHTDKCLGKTALRRLYDSGDLKEQKWEKRAWISDCGQIVADDMCWIQEPLLVDASTLVGNMSLQENDEDSYDGPRIPFHFGDQPCDEHKHLQDAPSWSQDD